jgi:hypothetical protein
MIFTRGHLRQVMHLLFFVAVGVDRIHAQRALHGGEAAQARIAALHFLADQAVADAVHAGAAVLFGNGGAEQAEAGDFRNQFLGETPLIEAVANDRQDFFVDETADGVLDHALFVSE